MTNSALFDDWPERYERWFDTPTGRLVRAIEGALLVDLVAPRQGELLLDAGCGTGIFTRPLLSRGATVVGIDLSVAMLRHARVKIPEERFTPAAANLLALPFADDRFDKTLSVTALEFVTDGERALGELFRVTRPGGQVLVATLNSLGPWARRREQAARDDATSLFRRARFRSPDELRALAPCAGSITSAIHFPKDCDPAEALRIEERGRLERLETGAFLVGCWRKPNPR